MTNIQVNITGCIDVFAIKTREWSIIRHKSPQGICVFCRFVKKVEKAGAYTEAYFTSLESIIHLMDRMMPDIFIIQFFKKLTLKYHSTVKLLNIATNNDSKSIKITNNL